MSRHFWLAGLMALVMHSAQAGDLYRWVDSSGRVYYGDLPPVDATEVEIRKFPEGIMASEYLPYETRKAQQNFPVVLYVALGCSELCNQARSLLNKRGIPYSERMVRTKDEIDAFRRLTGSEIVPTLAVGKTILKVFQSEQWHDALDIAGYPKTATYRQRIAPPVPPVPSAPGTPSVEGSSSEYQPAPEEPAAP